MNDYGRAAVRAVELYTGGLARSPQEAWMRATAEFFGWGTTSQNKGCPRGAFLGLCEEGLIKGMPRGSYTRSAKNKKYALNAVAVLRQAPTLAADPIGLWRVVMRGETKVHNHQMDVVTSLWSTGLIVGRPS